MVTRRESGKTLSSEQEDAMAVESDHPAFLALQSMSQSYEIVRQSLPGPPNRPMQECPRMLFPE